MKLKIYLISLIIITILSICSISNLILRKDTYDLEDYRKEIILIPDEPLSPSDIISPFITNNSDPLNGTYRYMKKIDMELQKGILYLHYGSNLDSSKDPVHIYLTLVPIQAKGDWRHDEEVQQGFGRFDGRKIIDVEGGDYLLVVESEDIDSLFLTATSIRSFSYYSTIIICSLNLILLGVGIFLFALTLIRKKRKEREG